MPLPLLVLAGTGTEVTPVGTATTDIVSYVLGYGLAGVIALAFAFRFIVPASVVKEAREQARADIKAELDRTITRAQRAEQQRDEALKVSSDQLIPLLINFTSVSQALLPLLQELVRDRERSRSRDPGR